MVPMPTRQPVADAEQFKLYLPKRIVARLREAAVSYNRESANRIASEIIEMYFPFWEEIEKARLAEYKKQQQVSSGNGDDGEIEDAQPQDEFFRSIDTVAKRPGEALKPSSGKPVRLRKKTGST